jgi:exodeoxyribonuclease-5
MFTDYPAAASVLPRVAVDPVLSDEQEAAMAKIDAFMADADRQLLVLHGCAGTGKTTLAAHAVRQYPEVGLHALTGKAAAVLRERTGVDASTIHSYFYKLRRAWRDEHGRQHLDFRPRHLHGTLQGHVVLVDECSMVPRSVGEQLLRTGVKVIAVGDPGQLPPIDEPQFFNTPDITLRAIHRQAAGSPILRQAMQVRRGVRYRADGDGFRVVHRTNLGMLAQTDAVLCHTNKTRRKLNRLCHRLGGHPTPWPEAGEPLVCLRNAPAYGIWNGGIYPAGAPVRPGDDMVCVRVDGAVVTIPNAAFVGEPPPADVSPPRSASVEFDYGYALTVHKAQGSEWPRVLLIDEYHRAEHWPQWTYTAITRAACSIVVVPR